MEAIMSAFLGILAMMLLPVGIGFVENRIQIHRQRVTLANRLACVTEDELDPELATAWLNRLALRSRLQEYGSRESIQMRRGCS
jgi:hypothetical protein